MALGNKNIHVTTGKTATITLDNIKDEGWGELGHELGMNHKKINKVFEYGEFGSVTIIVDEDLNIIGGHINPCGK